MDIAVVFGVLMLGTVFLSLWAKRNTPFSKTTLVYPWWVLSLSAFGFGVSLIFIALIVLGKIKTTHYGGIVGIVLFGVVAILSGLLIHGYFKNRPQITRRGLYYQNVFGLNRRFMSWENIRRVSYSDFWGYLRIADTKGNTANIPAIMEGLPWLLLFIRNYVPDHAIDSTISLLEAQIAPKQTFRSYK